MRNTLYPLSWVTGVIVVQHLPALPAATPRVVMAVLSVVLLVVAWTRCPSGLKSLFVAIALILAAILWASWRADARLAQALHPDEDNKVTRVAVLLTDLPEQVDGGVRFIGQVNVQATPDSASPQGAAERWPERVLIDWPGACTGDCASPLNPGQRWRMALRFRAPHGRMNAHGFDTAGWLFEKGVLATATVRGQPQRLTDVSVWNPSLWVVRLRSHIRARMLRLLQGKREAPVIIALSIGDQQGVSADDWQVFNTTGITHLVSISGSHVTLIAALGAALLGRLYRRLKWRSRQLSESWPTRLVFVWSAVVVAFFYCLLAGWGVPAQRTFFMLVCAAIGLSGRLPLSGYQTVALAAAIMTVLDPWSVLSTGFWLSFAAVTTLIVIAEQAPQWCTVTQTETKTKTQLKTQTKRQRLVRAVLTATHLQWVMTIGTTPILAYLFHQVSFAAMPANAWAIPWITFVATPLALLLSAACLLPVPDVWLSPLAWLAHESLDWSLRPVRWLASFEVLAADVSAMPLIWLVLALAGVLAAVCLPPVRWRWLGYTLMLPGLLYRPSTPAIGGWQLTVFDVGQGASALLKTHTKTLLFDTGWRFGEVDAVQRVVLPELKARGIGHLDRVIISHPDSDHVGGLKTLQTQRSVGHLMGAGVPQATPCRSGQGWTEDGVKFEFLHPQDDCAKQSLTGLLRNRCSCVLLVSGRWHTALLTGDIDAVAENQLIQAWARRGAVAIDVISMPHHGSRTGSSAPFVAWSQAKHAVAQAGRHNRFGHPHPSVVTRWQAHGAITWVSAQHGSVQFDSNSATLVFGSATQQRQRYWHGQGVK